MKLYFLNKGAPFYLGFTLVKSVKTNIKNFFVPFEQLYSFCVLKN